MRIIMLHPHDPTAFHVGGIGTFINNYLKYAPSDFEIHFVGITRDSRRFPVGEWKTVEREGRSFRFLPVLFEPETGRRRIPLSLQFSWALNRYRSQIDFRKAILEFHRIEPSFVLRDLKNPKVLFLHGHMGDLYHPKTEVRWGRFPWIYFFIEGKLIKRMTRIHIVREDAVSFYQRRYPALAGRFSFLPTWVDDGVFKIENEQTRRKWKEELSLESGMERGGKILLFVGRFEGQKDPMFLLNAFHQLRKGMDKVFLVMIGKGSLERPMTAYLEEHGLSEGVRILRPMAHALLVRWMNAADAFVLSSAFEGMPFVLAEAIQCGLPVVAMKVGETGRFIRAPAAGRLVEERNPAVFAAAIQEVLRQPRDREACQEQVSEHVASKRLKLLYDDHRKLGAAFL